MKDAPYIFLPVFAPTDTVLILLLLTIVRHHYLFSSYVELLPLPFNRIFALGVYLFLRAHFLSQFFDGLLPSKGWSFKDFHSFAILVIKVGVEVNSKFVNIPLICR